MPSPVVPLNRAGGEPIHLRTSASYRQTTKGLRQPLIFHLNNKEARKQLNVNIQHNDIPNDEAPSYLGIKLDRSLIFKQHAEKVKNKIKTRKNIIGELAGTS